jgi:hypothetical protein
MKPLALLLIIPAVWMSSCASVPRMKDGADSVMITSLEERVRGEERLDEETFRVGGMVIRTDEVIDRLAKNFTHSRGGNLAFVKSKWKEVDFWLLLPSMTTYAQIEAYRTNPEDTESGN